MGIETRIKEIPANPKNYQKANRKDDDIKYIVLHYTSNINDTDVNNGIYFRDNVTGSSAHFFVRDDSITCSVSPASIAWAVGLGSMKAPYIANPTHYKICTNSNSISIEMCGGIGTREATEKTKDTTAQLAAYLLDRYHLGLDRLIMHYNVTGKQCPAWMVQDPQKYADMKARVMYYMEEKEISEMTDEQFAKHMDKWIDKNGETIFCTFMRGWMEEQAKAPATWEAADMEWAEKHGFIRDGQPKANVTRGQLAAILKRLGDVLQWRN